MEQVKHYYIVTISLILFSITAKVPVWVAIEPTISRLILPFILCNCSCPSS